MPDEAEISAKFIAVIQRYFLNILTPESCVQRIEKDRECQITEIYLSHNLFWPSYLHPHHHKLHTVIRY